MTRSGEDGLGCLDFSVRGDLEQCRDRGSTRAEEAIQPNQRG
jgi:hypothetical protein